MSSSIISGLKCRATGIGSVPHLDINHICDFIIRTFPDMPFWPQAVNSDSKENMIIQFVENMPCLRYDKNENKILYDDSDKENELHTFYQYIQNKDYDHFRISRDFARGFYIFLENTSNTDAKIVKGHVTGPVTFLFSIKDKNGRSVLFDKTMRDVAVKALAMKAVWQAREIKKTGRKAIIFFDEPGMTLYGSEHLNPGREMFVSMFADLIKTVHENSDASVGIHCCGSTDWSILLESDVDILSFEAYSYSENFLFYHEYINRFLRNGNIIAWGIVPTTDFNESIEVRDIEKKFYDIVNALTARGTDKDLILRNSIFTPACGTGTLSQTTAEQILSLTAKCVERLLK